jgi:hypothetical protein
MGADLEALFVELGDAGAVALFDSLSAIDASRSARSPLGSLFDYLT